MKKLMIALVVAGTALAVVGIDFGSSQERLVTDGINPPHFT